MAIFGIWIDQSMIIKFYCIWLCILCFEFNASVPFNRVCLITWRFFFAVRLSPENTKTTNNNRNRFKHMTKWMTNKWHTVQSSVHSDHKDQEKKKELTFAIVYLLVNWFAIFFPACSLNTRLHTEWSNVQTKDFVHDVICVTNKETNNTLKSIAIQFLNQHEHVVLKLFFLCQFFWNVHQKNGLERFFS